MPKHPSLPPPSNQMEVRLEQLEREVVKGQRALSERNRLVCEMAGKGYTQADITRRLNRQRTVGGAKPLTPDAIAVIVKRHSERGPENETD